MFYFIEEGKHKGKSSSEVKIKAKKISRTWSEIKFIFMGFRYITIKNLSK